MAIYIFKCVTIQKQNKIVFIFKIIVKKKDTVLLQYFLGVYVMY